MSPLKFLVIICVLKSNLALQSDEYCGVADQTEGLIFNGTETKKQEWPWSAAIFHKTDGVNLKFICGSTIVTRRKLITAAHCVFEKYTTKVKLTGDFLIKIGIHDLQKTETGSVTAVPSSITFHPEWNPMVTNYDADIAVIELPEELQISKFIRPICIWERRRGAPQFHEGTIVGWGSSGPDTNAPENIARKVKVPIVTNENCFLDQPAFTQLASNRTFCGGAKNGQGPCKGDSGSGLYFEYENKFYLGGIVSASTLDVFFNCDVTNYAVYTNVFKFIPWLSNKKFSEKSQSELACDSYKGKRPPRPDFLKASNHKLNEADEGEFGHMAILTLLVKNGSEPNVHCNGFLVSDKFVVSAAQCITSKFPLSHVRLGAVTEDLKDDKNIPIAVDVKVKKTIIHEKYSTRKKENDIALIELEHSVPLSYFIWPACLFTLLDDSRRFWVASSYQKNQNEDIATPFFLKIPVEEVPVADCKKKYSKIEYFKGEISLYNLCNKQVISNINLCKGSVGAPLQILQDDQYFVGGFGTFGSSRCDDVFPSIATRIASYIEWIEERVWPEEEMSDLSGSSSTVKPRVSPSRPQNSDLFLFPED